MYDARKIRRKLVDIMTEIGTARQEELEASENRKWDSRQDSSPPGSNMPSECASEMERKSTKGRESKP